MVHWAAGGTIRRRILLATGIGGLVALAAGAGAGLYLLGRPDLVARGVERALGWPEGSVAIEALEVGRRVGVRGLALRPPERHAPAVAIGRIEVDWPEPWSLLRGVVDLGTVTVDEVTVAARTQAPGPPPREGGIELRAERVTVRKGRFTAPEELPLRAVAVEGIRAAFREVRWWPRARRIEGRGDARIAHMELGAIALDGIVAPAVRLTDGDLHLGPSTFHYGRTPAVAEGVIRDLDRRPEVELAVELAGSRVEEAVEDATGRASPLMGWLTSRVTVRAGGELPRGQSRIEGWVQLDDAHVFVGDELKLIPRVLLDLAPWFRREDGGWLAIGDLRGEASFGRGWVDLARLERPSERHRVLQAWGHLREGAVDVTVRAVPKRDEEKPGVGVRLQGPIGRAKLQLAEREHLLDAPEPIERFDL